MTSKGIQRTEDGWRVALTLGSRRPVGSYRTTKEGAEQDLAAVHTRWFSSSRAFSWDPRIPACPQVRALWQEPLTGRAARDYIKMTACR